jgi:hypothetical protein
MLTGEQCQYNSRIKKVKSIYRENHVENNLEDNINMVEFIVF